MQLQDSNEVVVQHFGEDLDRSSLTNQLAVLSDVVPGVNVSLKAIVSSIH